MNARHNNRRYTASVVQWNTARPLKQRATNLLSVQSSPEARANCQRIKVVVNLFHLAFVNYHKCHNHQKTTTDDSAHANVWHFYLCTLCSVALSFLLCLSHIIPHLPHIIILPPRVYAPSLNLYMETEPVNVSVSILKALYYLKSEEKNHHTLINTLNSRGKYLILMIFVSIICLKACFFIFQKWLLYIYSTHNVDTRNNITFMD